MKKLVIVGGGGFAREILWLIEEINRASHHHDSPYQVLGFITNDGASQVNGIPVLGDDQWAFANLDKNTRFVLAVGASELRARLAATWVSQGYHPLRLVHPSVIMSDEVQLGPGAVVCAGAVITVNVRMGAFCLVNLNATIGHDCVLGDFVTLHPGAHLSGGVEVGEGASLGTGAVVLPGVKVGARSQVGAGAVVTEDLAGDATYVGIPARETASQPG